VPSSTRNSASSIRRSTRALTRGRAELVTPRPPGAARCWAAVSHARPTQYVGWRRRFMTARTRTVPGRIE
jgi:hypothetical protein